MLAILYQVLNVKAAVKKNENDAPTIGYYVVDEIKVIKSKKNKNKHQSEPVPEELLDLE